ncbi:TATA box-binding protein-associated factor RNA polymerase I subunit B-like [Brienomyrus brachyistius]|uniref:TATA box-binding protein-associated factor RNA polymerase I subunit B-like n=1 Tax=Brienomyrus brachyistius TaxID=42636 RepID=UPI0020B31604|nr:TATA box-binding protein-associated factor RNA polymerase I subunit B-like [Brienomyrus brachyistius]
MDEELIGFFRDPCSQCSAVNWGVTEEGRYYCKSCHNVIERTVEVTDPSCVTGSRMSSISHGAKKPAKQKHGKDWMVCEGFQFILKQQAEALLTMGVRPELKDDILCNFWRGYLHKSKQAYTTKPLYSVTCQQDSDSCPESLAMSDLSCLSTAETESDMDGAHSTISGRSSDGERLSSVCTEALDSSLYCSARERRMHHLMTMPMTLAFLHLSLLWLQEAITLADLLSFTAQGHIPYINAYQNFPEDMKLFGKDALIFRAESIPSYKMVQQEAHKLAVFLGLPRFPPLTSACPLHPSLLCLRYLMELNLPDELHVWACRVMQQAGIGKDTLTYDPRARKSGLLSYDVLASALIVVTLKLLFKLDDHQEWCLSNSADDENKQNQDSSIFCFRKWYKTVQGALIVAKETEDQAMAWKSWKSQKPVYPSKKNKSVVIKRRRVVEQLQAHFQKLTGSDPEPRQGSPSSFRLRWGEEDGDGPSYQERRLGSAVKERKGIARPSNPTYWHTSLSSCNPRQCGDHFPEVEDSLPRSYVSVLGMISFLLGVQEAHVHAEVCMLEQLLFSRPRQPPIKTSHGSRRKKQTEKRKTPG